MNGKSGVVNAQRNRAVEFTNAFYSFISISFLIIHIAFINIRYIAVPSQYIFIFVFAVRFISTKSKLSGYIAWSAIYLFLSCLSIFYSPSQAVTFSAILNVGQVIVFCNLMLPYLLDSNKNFDSFVNGIIIATFVLLVRLVIATPFYEWGTSRVGSAIGYNPNTIGLYFSFSAILASLYFREKRAPIYLLFALVLGATSLFSGSKKAFFVMVLGVSLAFGLGKISLRRILILGIVLILVPIVMYYTVMTWDALYYVLGRRLEPFFAGLSNRNFGEVDVVRFEMIKVGIDLFAKRPFLGYGIGSYRLVAGFNTYAHNNYIELLVSIGLIGTIVYYSMHFYVLVSAVKKSLKTKFNNITYLIPLIIICIILIIDMGLVNYSDEYFQFLVLLSFACVKKKASGRE